MLTSVTFRQVDRLKRFLNFTVSEALAGRGDQLKEYVIGVQVFDKDSSFDPRADPIVRVQARRLRARLVRYYREEGGTDALVIELPKGGYTPVFKNREATRLLAPLARDDARGTEHDRGAAVRGPQPGEGARLLLRRPAAGDHSQPGEVRGAAGARGAAGRGAGRWGSATSTPARSPCS